MSRCAACRGRVRPPSRPWTDSASGVHFYSTISSMKLYEKWLAALAKRVSFVHERCEMTAVPGTLPDRYVVALDLQAQLR